MSDAPRSECPIAARSASAKIDTERSTQSGSYARSVEPVKSTVLPVVEYDAVRLADPVQKISSIHLGWETGI